MALRLFKRVFARVWIVAFEVSSVLFWLFGLYLPALVCLLSLATGVVIFYVANSADMRSLTGNNLKGKSGFANPFFEAKKKKPKGEALFDREAMYHKIDAAVKLMSNSKTGAIITFERSDNLDDIINASGTRINAPVSTELLQTIFFVGTRLHDGAVIIRNDMIAAASVYYRPTTRALTGKFGSRHRAAIGISEICDAVTVVVSEETGRISIAYKGQLNSVTPENFYARFTEYMKFEPESKEQ
ncbi:MAG: DNA integrity scanning protein DisA nucleotide-binding domain protein [Bacilli bacterium]|nr:DNA integrity scanning protein DisA nucleotide-binding domain protein [Bacilli bacterium]